MEKKEKKELKKLIGGYNLLGIVLVFVSLLLKNVVMYYKQYFAPLLFELLCTITDMLSIIGTTLVIGAIFDIVRNTEDYTDIIKKTLIEVVQDRQFLQGLSHEEKKRDIFKIIGGDEDVHTDIKKHIDTSIDKILNIYMRPYRTNTNYIFTAKIENEQLVIDGTISYNLHKNLSGKFDNIVSVYENINSKIKGVNVIVSGRRKKLAIDIKKVNGRYIYETIIPNELQEHQELEIEQQIVEVYKSDQANFYAKVVAPTYGFRMHLRCLDEHLEIVDSFVFDAQESFDIVCEERQSITVKSIEWIDEWHGIVIQIGRR